MPGTIQVSILELVGVPSLSQSSSMGIKVSMGKQAHEMQDKGDHSFTLVSLRDNLSVSVHDSEGNEIGHTGVETRSVIEKGTWEDLFSLEGGGHVRMRLHFILTEDEEKRIRSVRESATRRKRQDIIKRSHSSSSLAAAPGGSSASPRDLLKTTHLKQQGNLNPADRHANMISAGSSAKVQIKVPPGQKKQAFSTSKSTSSLDKLPGYQRLKEVIQERDAENTKQGQMERTPSSIRNMILAFESSPVKEALPATSKIKTTSRLSSISTTNIPLKVPKKTVAVSGKPFLTNLETVAAPSPENRLKEREDSGDYMAACQETFSSITEQSEKLKVQSVDQMSNEIQLSTKELNKEELQLPKQLKLEPLSEESSVSWKALFGALPRRKYTSTDAFTVKKVSTSYDSLVLERTWRSNHWRSYRHKVKSKASYGNECCSSDSHHGWIFLEEMINPCVVNGDRTFIDVSDGALSDCNRAISQQKVRDTEVPSNDETNSVDVKDIKSTERTHSTDLIRPVRQVLNIAIMVGFGLLVLLTRQRK